MDAVSTNNMGDVSSYKCGYPFTRDTLAELYRVPGRIIYLIARSKR